MIRQVAGAMLVPNLLRIGMSADEECGKPPPLRQSVVSAATQGMGRVQPAVRATLALQRRGGAQNPQDLQSCNLPSYVANAAWSTRSLRSAGELLQEKQRSRRVQWTAAENPAASSHYASVVATFCGDSAEVSKHGRASKVEVQAPTVVVRPAPSTALATAYGRLSRPAPRRRMGHEHHRRDYNV